MRIVFAVLTLSIAFVASYPSYQKEATENEDNDLDLELRSILNHLSEEKMERSVTSDEDNDESDADEYEVSKRQGGHNIIDKQSTCEIKCIHGERNPKFGKGKTVKEAAKVCKQKCPKPDQKRGGKKSNPKSGNKLSLREFTDDDSSSNSDEQQAQRREFYDYLMEQLQQDNDE